MQKRIDSLIDFISKYGEDFLDDGTKGKVIRGLEQGNKQLAIDILNSIDENWIKRTKEVNKFLIFSDWEKSKISKTSDKPFYKANYIDSLQMGEKIPTLRRIKIRNHEIFDDFDEWGR